MNKERRKAILAIATRLEASQHDLESIQAAEEDYRDNIPENLQGSERYELSDLACDNLSEVACSLEDVIGSLLAVIAE